MEDRHTLSVLESLSENSDVNQRKIAHQTGLNLAKVNFVLKKLTEKGFIKLQRVKENPHKRRYLYLLTPAGMAEKSRLTYRFLKNTLRQYEEAESRVRDCIESMVAQGVRRVALWGRTEITELCLRVLNSMDGHIKVIGVVDTQDRHNSSLTPYMLDSMVVDAILVCEDKCLPPPGYQTWRLP